MTIYNVSSTLGVLILKYFSSSTFKDDLSMFKFKGISFEGFNLAKIVCSQAAMKCRDITEVKVSQALSPGNFQGTLYIL